MSAQDKMAMAQVADEAGRYDEARRYVKEFVAETTDVDARIHAAFTVWSMYARRVLRGHSPEYGTQAFNDCRKYLRIALDNYKQASPASQASFENYLHSTNNPRIALLKDALSMLDRDEACNLYEAGKSEEGIRILKQIVEENSSPDQRIAAAHLIASFLISRNQQPPAPGTSEYVEIGRYSKIALDTWDQATPKEIEDNFSNPAEQAQTMQWVRDIYSLVQQGRSIEDLSTLESARNKKSGCFIATATYGSPIAPEVIIFRRFRDEFLVTSKLGALLIEIYYRVSPPFASLIAKTEFLRALTRHLFLAPILRLLKAKKFDS